MIKEVLKNWEKILIAVLFVAILILGFRSCARNIKQNRQGSNIKIKLPSFQESFKKVMTLGADWLRKEATGWID